ncbi:hypothetical protein [Wolbachia endosymbiont (group A) of Ancistrocerus nigricornis]|nr:hypothetical protein [Wolbachia endosymbiont (group A) of Ancistrocerus nigricornis]
MNLLVSGQPLNTQARKTMKELAENGVERVFEKYFHQQLEYIK